MIERLSLSLTTRHPRQFRLIGLFALNQLLGKLPHKTAAQIFINHGAGAVGVGDMFIGGVAMSMAMGMTVRVLMGMAV